MPLQLRLFVVSALTPPLVRHLRQPGFDFLSLPRADPDCSMRSLRVAGQVVPDVLVNSRLELSGPHLDGVVRLDEQLR
jgi:hypothetical protein